MILALAPHTDDAILGAGGYLSLCSGNGDETGILAFSTGNHVDGAKESEFEAAAAQIGVGETRLLDCPVRAYDSVRQEILLEIERVIEEWDPHLLIIPAKHDHQDHRVIHREAIRAARKKQIGILAYEQPWHQTMCSFSPTAFVELNTYHLNRKIKAVGCFTSQAHRSYTDGKYISANARRWGVCIEAEFAEVFEVVKWVIC